MPHETDASALIWLVWMVWIYWGIRNWLKNPSAGEDTENHGPAAVTGATARLTAAMPGFPAINEKVARAAVPNRLAAFVAQIRQADPHFNLNDFLEGATAAYEAVTIAFATGDRITLKPLLARGVYEAFDAAIARREARGETMDAIFSRIGKPEISDSSFVDGLATLTVRFTSDLFRTTFDMQGKVIEGSPTAETRVRDTWVFARPQGSRDPAWQVVATNAAPPAIAAAERCCA
jgi:predicted lipid-binding transport protein (Tim44 family)